MAERWTREAFDRLEASWPSSHAPHGAGPAGPAVRAGLAAAPLGFRRYQRKIFGKGDGDEITIGRQVRLHLKKQNVMLYVTSR